MTQPLNFNDRMWEMLTSIQNTVTEINKRSAKQEEQSRNLEDRLKTQTIEYQHSIKKMEQISDKTNRNTDRIEELERVINTNKTDIEKNISEAVRDRNEQVKNTEKSIDDVSKQLNVLEHTLIVVVVIGIGVYILEKFL